MIRRPPRSTPLSLHDALPISWRRPAAAAAPAATALPRTSSFTRARTTAPSPAVAARNGSRARSEEHTSELQSRQYLVCRLLLEKKKIQKHTHVDKHHNSPLMH